ILVREGDGAAVAVSGATLEAFGACADELSCASVAVSGPDVGVFELALGELAGVSAATNCVFDVCAWSPSGDEVRFGFAGGVEFASGWFGTICAWFVGCDV